MAKTANFNKICLSDGSVKANDINLNRTNTIKVFCESGILMGLSFSIPSKGECVSDYWQRRETQMGHFHTMSL